MPQLFVRSGDTLTKLAEEDLTEAEGLQTWLADNPELLAGEEMEPDDPRRFLLVRREAPMAGLALDHLFVDQEAVPTLVETKKASNREARRQVVAQMLDYASEAAITWSGDMLKGWFEQRCESSGLDAEQELAQFKPDLEDHGEFWQRAKENLRDGKVRLIFACDEIPSSLRRIIEFLNERMDPTSVLGLEVRRHHAEGVEIFSSTLVGATERARAIKGGQKPQWDEDSFLAELEAKRGSAEVQVARELIEWARVELPRLTWGTGAQTGSFFPVLDHAGRDYWPISLQTDGRVTIEFAGLSRRGRTPFDDVRQRREFVRRLNETAGVAIPEDAVDKRPRVRLAVLAASPEALDSFKAALDWFCETVRSHPGDHANE
jgi:hypothetical protein